MSSTKRARHWDAALELCCERKRATYVKVSTELVRDTDEFQRLCKGLRKEREEVAEALERGDVEYAEDCAALIESMKDCVYATPEFKMLNKVMRGKGKLWVEMTVQ